MLNLCDRLRSHAILSLIHFIRVSILAPNLSVTSLCFLGALGSYKQSKKATFSRSTQQLNFFNLRKMDWQSKGDLVFFTQRLINYDVITTHSASNKNEFHLIFQNFQKTLSSRNVHNSM